MTASRTRSWCGAGSAAAGSGAASTAATAVSATTVSATTAASFTIAASAGVDPYAYPGVPDMPPAGTQAAPQPGGGYSYDGGPSNPVPLPGAAQPGPAQPAPVQPAPANGPRRVVPQPAQGLLVSV